MSLTDIPKPPHNFSFIADEYQPAKYIVGSDEFTPADFPIASIFTRQVFSADEYILGILSVLIIAILSDIAHTILLRTSRKKLSANGLLLAYLISELSHFRNICTYIRLFRRNSSTDSTSASSARRRACISVTVLSVTLLLFAADVIAVVLTQSKSTTSAKHDYNLLAVQPISTNHNLSRYIRRLTAEGSCISPDVAGGKQRRNYNISTCVSYSERLHLIAENDLSDVIEIASWFHRGGSDHNITVGDGFLSVRIRAQLFLDVHNGGNRHFLFDTRDDDALSHAQYLHRLVIYDAMDWSCNKRFSGISCEKLARQLRLSTRTEQREILLWAGENVDVIDSATGLVTTCAVTINAPHLALQSAMGYLVSSSAILEIAGKSLYSRGQDGKFEDGIPGLLSEEGHVAGIVLFAILFFVLTVVTILLRIFLKPVSLGFVAVSSVHEQVGVDIVDPFRFEGVEAPAEEDDLWDSDSQIGVGGTFAQ